MEKREVYCPMPQIDAQGLQHADTISRLERGAEELSQGGSDIGEEIRKMQEQERSRSRSGSRQNPNLTCEQEPDLPRPRARRIGSQTASQSGRSRASSYATSSSIVEVNSNARWGGYSPAAFVASPTGSVRSHGSWTHASVSRAASGSKTSLARMVAEPLQERRPLHSPLAPSTASLYSQEHQMSRQPSQSSFSRPYDQIASQMEESLQPIPPMPSVDEQMQHIQHHEPAQHPQHEHIESEPPERPHSADTFHEAQIAFRDFDGVHFDPDSEEYVEVDDEGNEVRRISARNSSGSLLDAASLLRTPRARPMSYGVPPPGDSMVYYPAPVPRMLNLPKRLSTQPPAHIQQQRRSQMLAGMSPRARESALWIPPITFSEGETKSQRSSSESAPQSEHPRGMLDERMSVQNLPAQLRASMFFEHPSVPHNVEVKSESAVATLDAILASSVTAPVSAFTDHPYAGDVRKTVYAPERPNHNRKSTATTLGQMSSHSLTQEKKIKKRRSSSIGNFFRRNSTTLDAEVENRRPASRGSALDFNEGGKKLRKRKSQMSMGDEMARSEGLRTPGDEIDDPMKRLSSGGLIEQAKNQGVDHERAPSDSRPLSVYSDGNPVDDGEQIEQDFKDQEARSDIDEDDEVLYAPPATLLAELQHRKAQLKSRNRTAATAFPNGMHSTLLQLDAVEQIEAKKRKRQKIALAWEDPSLRQDEEEVDEDVPLGVLFPSREGNAHRRMGNRGDWNRPLGLMDRREMEDNEPLSSRRLRMNPHARPIVRNATAPMALRGQPNPDDEDEEETLGQRLRRLKTKEALDLAINDVERKDGDRPVSTFTEEFLSQFGGLEVKNPDDDKSTMKENKPNQAGGGAEQEETLGQRRARLQREREASGEVPSPGAATRPALRQTQSMASVLSANPIGMRGASANHSAAHGTLLHASEQQQMKHKMDLLNKNSRSSMHMLGNPLVDSRPQITREPSSGLLAQTSNRPANGAYQGNSTIFQGVTSPDAPLQKIQSFGGLLGQQTSRPSNGAFAGGYYNNTGGGVPMQLSGSQPMFGMGGGQGYTFASPTAGMQAYGGYGNNAMTGVGYGMQAQQPSMMNNAAYYALHGGHTSVMPGTMPAYGNPVMASGYGYPQQTPGPQMTYASMAQVGQPATMNEMPIEPHQREAIDRWRMGVA
ncbi:uncharacterized protein MYCFIDRAFT_83000 [Pseudocercospora fijiensis CIRAD86]|uniref:Uncharacterized protein n=1 Tax=Pseudocercospora fijiensis (strain CIRAD86) TaxID=383855 RepID=M3AK41_PSEFD|nr:uncharacterized protein MYCFIDRAFT_83000 [Pseudocercospora fijiensis CIRAD86]EME84946.1 hypothetical protein MYCFIDRAFT_83000 [Pseudocercospora fijiensis CIRAD86]